MKEKISDACCTPNQGFLGLPWQPLKLHATPKLCPISTPNPFKFDFGNPHNITIHNFAPLPVQCASYHDGFAREDFQVGNKPTFYYSSQVELSSLARSIPTLLSRRFWWLPRNKSCVCSNTRSWLVNFSNLKFVQGHWAFKEGIFFLIINNINNNSLKINF